MRIRISTYFILLTLVPFYNGCSGGSSVAKEKTISIRQLKVNAWVNLMPGKDPSFHVSGEAQLINNSDSIIKNISFDNAVAYQNNLRLFDFTPDIKIINNQVDLLPKDTLRFNFKNLKDLTVNSGFDFNNMINILLTISYGSKKSEIIFKNVKVEKVY